MASYLSMMAQRLKEIKKMNPQDQDFDWVKARAECSLSAEFVGLRCLVRKNIEIRNGLS